MRAVPGLVERVEQTIDRYAMLRDGQTIGVAVSGGADSVCLLDVLVELAPRRGVRLCVLHLNHRLRGVESETDARFVRDLADLLGLPFHLREVDLGAGNLEQAGRQARLAFFRDLVERRIVDRVAVGHSRSDLAETVLYRFLRGSGTAGLAGIRPVTDLVVRPLLEVGREDVEQHLTARGVSWRTDSSNADLRFARNRIRHNLLPQLEADWNPGIRETLAHTAEWAQAEEEYWSAEIARLADGRLTERHGGILLALKGLSGLPLAAARRLVRLVIERTKGDTRSVDFHHISTILGLAIQSRGAGRVQIPGVEVWRSFEWLLFRPSARCTRADYRVRAVVPGAFRVPGTDLAICLELIEKTETFEVPDCVYNSDVGFVNWAGLSGELEIRNWRAGDQYQPVGSTRKEKIKTLFHQARIPVWEREYWPILTDGASIVWARRFGAAAEHAAQPGNRTILMVRETSG